jgi:hypothetical protein
VLFRSRRHRLRGYTVLTAAQTVRPTAYRTDLIAETLGISLIGVHNTKIGIQHTHFIIHGVQHALQAWFKNGLHNLPVI